jgi:hypothetical protein
MSGSLYFERLKPEYCPFITVVKAIIVKMAEIPDLLMIIGTLR